MSIPSQKPTDHKMHRRSYSVPLEQSHVGTSSSGACIHVAHEALQGPLPMHQARVSITEDSPAQRIPQSHFSDVVGNVRDREEAFRGQAARLPPIYNPDETNSRHVGWSTSTPSQTSFSEDDLAPCDSISNRGSGSNGHSMHSHCPNISGHPLHPNYHHVNHNINTSGICPAHGRYVSNECYDPGHGGQSRLIGPNENRAPNNNTIDLKNNLEVYREVPRIPRNPSGDGTNSFPEAYDDDYEEPFMPRTDSHSDRSSLYAHDDQTHTVDDSGREWDLIDD